MELAAPTLPPPAPPVSSSPRREVQRGRHDRGQRGLRPVGPVRRGPALAVSLLLHLGLMVTLALQLELRPAASIDFGLQTTISGSLEVLLYEPAPPEEPEATTETTAAPAPEEVYQYVEVEDIAEPIDEAFDAPPIAEAPPIPLICAAQRPFRERLRRRPLRVTVEAPPPAPAPPVVAALRARAPSAPAAVVATAPGAFVAARKLPGYCPPPRYPRAARRRGWEGVVIVDVATDVRGLPDTVTLRRSAGHRILDEEVIDTVKRWRFTPALRGAEPVAATRTLRFVFQIRSGA